MANIIIKNFELDFPSISREVVEYHEVGSDELIAITDSGKTFLYDSFNRTIRKLPRYGSDMTENECRNEFGYRLRKIMLRKNISQMELSEKLGIRQPQLSNYINGKSTPSFYMVDRIARVLNCSIDELRYI